MRIETGYTPGIIGRIAELSVLAMHLHFGFGHRFEARVARDAADFANRLDSDSTMLWRVMEGEAILGTLAMDGEDLGPGLAHLRWFMFDERLRGKGYGRRLMKRACEWADERGYDETHLWTIRGLDAAAALYGKAGFVMAEEFEGDQWGDRVIERRYIRPRGG